MEDNLQREEQFNYAKNIPIQLCNICNTKGDITPRWFRFEDEEHCIHTIKILSIVSHKEINYVGIKMIQFICKTYEEDNNNKENLIELRYNILTHRWIFFQTLS